MKNFIFTCALLLSAMAGMAQSTQDKPKTGTGQAENMDIQFACAYSHCQNQPLSDFNMDPDGLYNPSFPPSNLFYLLLSDTLGCINLTSLVLPNNFIIRPEKEGDDLNGVSTLDILLINRHILGIDTLDSPYKFIAADANRSGTITTFDIVEFRKLILGVYTHLPNNKSWRFVPKKYIFPNPNNPFAQAIPDTVKLGLSTTFPIEFWAVKVGDVNCTAIVNAANAPGEVRSAAQLILEDQVLKTGQLASVPMHLNAVKNTLSGFQVAFHIDPSSAQIMGITAPALAGFGPDNYQISPSGDIAISWSDAGSGMTTPGEEPLFVLQLRAQTDGLLSEALTLQPRKLHPEAYDGALDIYNLSLQFSNPITSAQTAIFAPQPNPASGPVQIPVLLAQAAPVQWGIYDLQGRLLWEKTATLEAGLQKVEIPANAFSHSGLFIWRANTGTVEQSGPILFEFK